MTGLVLALALIATVAWLARPRRHHRASERTIDRIHRDRHRGFEPPVAARHLDP